MVNAINILINSLAISSLYATIAIGFTLIFGVGGSLNFAYAGQITVGGFSAYFLSNVWGYSIWLGLAGGMIAAGLGGFALYLGIVQFVQDQPIPTMILTFLSGFTVEHLLRIFVTSGSVTIAQPVPGQTTVLGQTVQLNMVFVFVSSWLIIIGLLGLINYTKIGKAIDAVSNTSRGAKLVGINTVHINLYTWVIAGVLAGFAGVLITSFRTGSWQMGFNPMILAFSIVILGGLGSIRGSVLGAYIIGTAEVITISLIDAGLVSFAALVILLAVLLVKPKGLFGREAITDF